MSRALETEAHARSHFISTRVSSFHVGRPNFRPNSLSAQSIENDEMYHISKNKEVIGTKSFMGASKLVIWTKNDTFSTTKSLFSPKWLTEELSLA